MSAGLITFGKRSGRMSDRRVTARADKNFLDFAKTLYFLIFKRSVSTATLPTRSLALTLTV